MNARALGGGASRGFKVRGQRPLCGQIGLGVVLWGGVAWRSAHVKVSKKNHSCEHWTLYVMVLEAPCWSALCVPGAEMWHASDPTPICPPRGHGLRNAIKSRSVFDIQDKIDFQADNVARLQGACFWACSLRAIMHDSGLPNAPADCPAHAGVAVHVAVH